LPCSINNAMSDTTVCPSILTPRMKLESFAERHLSSGIVDWLNDPEVVCYSDQRHSRHTLESSRAYMESFAGSPNQYWAIHLREQPEVMLGSITAYVDVFNSTADVGILLGYKAYWRGGYGSEAFSAVVNWLFACRRMRKVTAGTMASNQGMLAVMRRAGMHEEGRRERHFLVNGQEVDMVFAAVFSDHWAAIKSERGAS
jgi:ribosomal-protein-alanine N-acetyltransferase